MNDIEKIYLETNPYILKNKGFSTIEFKFIYSCRYNKNYLFYMPLLRQILLNTSKKYKTEKEYNEAYNKTFIISSRLNIYEFHNNYFLEFTLVVPDPKKIKNFDLEKALNFFIDTIYKPNVIDDEFNVDSFDREKRFLEEDINNRINDINFKAEQTFLNLVDDIGKLKDNIYNNLELVKKSNSKELYNIYKEIILNNKPIIIVYGDVNKKINRILKRCINIKNEQIIIEKENNKYLIPSKEINQVEEISNSNKSILYMGYKIKNMKKEDELYLGLITKILGSGSNDLVFKELRMNKKIIYSSDVWMKRHFGLLIVQTYINNSSKEKVIEGVNSAFDKLKNKKLLSSYLTKVIGDLEYQLIRLKDNRTKKLNDFINFKFEFAEKIEVTLERYKNIDIEVVLGFIDRLVLDTVYFLRGEFNEEE